MMLSVYKLYYFQNVYINFQELFQLMVDELILLMIYVYNLVHKSIQIKSKCFIWNFNYLLLEEFYKND